MDIITGSQQNTYQPSVPTTADTARPWMRCRENADTQVQGNIPVIQHKR